MAKSKKKKVVAKKPVAKKAVSKKAAPKKAKPVAATKAVKKWSTLTPLDDRLLVAVDGPAEKTAGGIIIPGTVAERPEQGTIVASGRGRRNKKGQVRPLDVGVGDKVLFAKYAGTKVELEGTELLILREEEVLGIVM